MMRSHFFQLQDLFFNICLKYIYMFFNRKLCIFLSRCDCCLYLNCIWWYLFSNSTLLVFDLQFCLYLLFGSWLPFFVIYILAYYSHKFCFYFFFLVFDRELHYVVQHYHEPLGCVWFITDIFCLPILMGGLWFLIPTLYKINISCLSKRFTPSLHHDSLNLLIQPN